MAWQPRWSRYRVPFSPFNRHTIWAQHVPDPPPPPPLTDQQAALKELQAAQAVLILVGILILGVAIIALAVWLQLVHFLMIGFPLACFYFCYRRYKNLLKKVSGK